ncbi:MAG: small multi-drug export protein [Pirellulales bacterium]
MSGQSTNSLDPRHWNDEREFKRRFPIVWAGTLFGPPLFAIGSVLFFLIAYGWESAAKLASTALFSFFVAGKMIILGGGIEHLEQRNFYSSEQLLLLVFAIDVMTVSFLVFHLGFLFRIPKMGSKMQLIADNGHMILDAHPWMRRATFVGLVVFVAVPLAMTGSVGGSILGRMLGMSRLATFAGVMLGNFFTCAAMYFGSELLRSYWNKDNPWLLVGGILVMAGILYVLLRRYQQSMRRLDKISQSEGS